LLGKVHVPFPNMKTRDFVVRVLDRLIDIVITMMFSGMVVLIILLVVMRYVFNSTIVGGYETLRFAFIYTTFLGAAVLVSRGEHIGMDIIVKHFPDTARQSVKAVEQSLIAALHVYLLVISIHWIQVTGGFPSAELKLPMKFIQISLPVACGLTALYALNRMVGYLVPNKKEDK